MKLPIYMDNHATTPVDPRVYEAMTPYFLQKFGNAASRKHSFGWEAEAAVEQARKEVAQLIGAGPKEIIFTSGATESDNLAIRGVAERCRDRGNHIITVATEHKAVLDTCRRLERSGFRVTYLPVDRAGLVDPDQVRRAINSRTILITVMFGNNEIGTIHPVADIGHIARENGVLFHTDATQAVGHVPVDVEKMNIDLLSLSAHKMYGPKGIGALYVRRKNPQAVPPMIEGGGHERGMRSGTLNVPGIVGLGRACRICGEQMDTESERLRNLRDRLKDGILAALDEVCLNGHATKRLPHNLNLSFAYVEAESLLMGLSDVALSTGSACTSAAVEPSYVMKALGVREDLLHCSIRFGLGRFNTEEEVNYVKDRVVEAVNRLRELSPLYHGSASGKQPER